MKEIRYMVFCTSCGYLGSYDNDDPPSCPKCDKKLFFTGYLRSKWTALSDEEKKELKDKWVNRVNNRNAFKCTTSNSFEGYRIVDYIGIKSGEIVLGHRFLTEASAALTDLIGSTSNSFGQTIGQKLTKAKSMALEQLVENCIDSNANAVIGVDLDIMTAESSMIVVCANGTAVIIEKI